MKKPKPKPLKHEVRHPKSGRASTPEVDNHLAAYMPKAMKREIDFDLERKAIQEILDAVVRLQTYIAMRER